MYWGNYTDVGFAWTGEGTNLQAKKITMDKLLQMRDRKNQDSSYGGLKIYMNPYRIIDSKLGSNSKNYNNKPNSFNKFDFLSFLPCSWEGS
jgi:hypothetical protein